MKGFIFGRMALMDIFILIYLGGDKDSVFERSSIRQIHTQNGSKQLQNSIDFLGMISGWKIRSSIIMIIN